MKKNTIIASALLLAAGIVLSGCLPTAHYTPMEMKQDSSVAKESKIVNRSFSQVASTVQRLAPRCLDTTIIVSGDVRDARTGTFKYTPKVKRSANQMTFTLQKRNTSLMIIGGYKGPKDGIYSLIVDAEPAGANKTKITIYEDEWYMAPPEYKDAVIGWATGEVRGCPVL